MVRCLNCGKKTANPKFCSQSCAAAYNNRKKPKRKPEGSCSRCGCAISTKRKLCEKCALEVKKEQAEGVLYNLRTYRGEPWSTRIQTLSVRRTLVFETWRQFQVGDLIGRYLEALLSVVLSKPEYIRHSDVERYAAYIHAFSTAKHRQYKGWPSNESETVPVADTAIDRLNFAAEDWVYQLMNDKTNGPLVVTYALDTIQLIEDHLLGHHWYDRSKIGARLEGMLTMNAQKENGLRYRQTTRNKELKKDITERNIGGVLTRVRVPDHSCMIARTHGQKKELAQKDFVFKIARCHLSENFYDDTEVEAQDAETIEYDIADNFHFHGYVYMNRSTGGFLSDLEEYGEEWRSCQAEVPVPWICSTISPDLDAETPVFRFQ